MSLKKFHILFIALSVATAFFFAAWLFLTPQAGVTAVRIFSGTVSLIIGLGLIAYAKVFLKKVRHI